MKKPLPRSLRYRRRPLVVPPPLCRACGRPREAHVAYDDGQPPLCPGRGGLSLWTPDTQKPGAPME